MRQTKKQIKGIGKYENKRERTNNRKGCRKYHFSNHKRTGIGTKYWNKTMHIMSKRTSGSTRTEHMTMVMNTAICNATPRKERSNDVIRRAESYIKAIDSCCSYNIEKIRSDLSARCHHATSPYKDLQGRTHYTLPMLLFTYSHRNTGANKVQIPVVHTESYDPQVKRRQTTKTDKTLSENTTADSYNVHQHASNTTNWPNPWTAQ